MANLRVIAEIKPAGDFPVVDAPNVSVTGGKRLDVALSEAAAEVASKANKSEVDTALASKANKSEVDAALASKANKSEVDAALAGKANKSEVDAAIENKADKSALEATNASVSANTSNIQGLSTESAALSARMDEFTKLKEGSTTGDAELADGRVGADGKTYDNIGGAIRGQVTDLKSDLNNKVDGNGNKTDIVIEKFDKNKVTHGAYLQSNGANQPLIVKEDADFGYTNLINAERVVYHFIGGSGDRIFFLDKEKKLKDVITTQADFTFDVGTMSDSIKYIQFYFVESNINSTHLYNQVSVNKIDYSQIDNAPDLSGVIVGNGNNIDIGAEQFDKNNVTVGAYLRSNGMNQSLEIVPDDDFGYSAEIPVENKEYHFVGGSGDRIFMLDANHKLKNVITTQADFIFNPVGNSTDIKYIQFYFVLNRLDSTSLKLPKIVGKIDFEQIDNVPYIAKSTSITLGDKGLNTINEAISYANSIANANNIVDVLIPTGEHNAFEGIDLNTVGNSFVGIVVGDYVNIYGVGSPENTKIYAEIPNGVYAFNRNNVSTLNLWRNNNMRNITVESKNMRYPVHNDKAINEENDNYIEYFENMIFVADGESEISADNIAFGSGCGKGKKTYFKNCKFITKTNPRTCTNFHNRPSQNMPCLWDFEHCEFIGGQHSMLLTNYGSGQNDTLNFRGCKTNAKFLFQSSSGSRICDYTLCGFGNSILGQNFNAAFNGVDDGDFHRMML